MSDYYQCRRVGVALELKRFVDERVLPDTGLAGAAFWDGFADIVEEFAPRNRTLMAERKRLQAELDAWHTTHPGPIRDVPAYRHFLESIGYLQPAPAEVMIKTCNLDLEVSDLAGLHLLAPAHDLQRASGAANARWSSLYEALNVSDLLSRIPDPLRPARIAVSARELLDRAAPLAHGSHVAARRYYIEDRQLRVSLVNGRETALRRPEQFRGHQGAADRPGAILLKNDGLHIEIQFDSRHGAGCTDVTGIKDLSMESALSALIDFGRSAETAHKLAAYRNWLGLMTGNRSAAQVEKASACSLNPDRRYAAADGGELVLPGRALLFAGVGGDPGICPAVLAPDRQPVSEGIVDGVMISLIALHDRRQRLNSRAGNIYLIKPGMQGPHEAAWANRLFDSIEDLLDLPRNTLKLGIVDDHFRTGVNLRACIGAAAERIAFVGTAVAVPQAVNKSTPWLEARERHSLLAALACGLRGRAQLCVGLSAGAAPLTDNSARPDAASSAQLWRAGVTTASLSATLHALHYHQASGCDTPQTSEQTVADTELLEQLLSVPVC